MQLTLCGSWRRVSPPVLGATNQITRVKSLISAARLFVLFVSFVAKPFVIFVFSVARISVIFAA